MKKKFIIKSVLLKKFSQHHGTHKQLENSDVFSHMRRTLTSLKTATGNMYAFGTEVARTALVKETHAPFLSHCCSGYPVGPLMTLLQAGCNVWGPQQRCTEASASPGKKTSGDGKPEEGRIIKRNTS